MKEAAEFLQVSKSTIYKLTMKKVIPYYQPNGGKIFFKELDLLNFIESSKVESATKLKITENANTDIVASNNYKLGT